MNDKVSHWQDKILDVTDSRLRRYLAAPFVDHALPRLPVAFQPSFNSARIGSQRGMFTIHGTLKQGLEEYLFGDHLIKVKIERRAVVGLKDELASLGIAETSAFPELEALFARDP